jgi:small subunit ribosomal protein S18
MSAGDPRLDDLTVPEVEELERGPGRGSRRFPRFASRFRTNVKPEEPLDYKNVAYLSRFLSPQGKILSRKRTGFSGQDQRRLSKAIKLSRFLGLLNYVG